MNRFLTLLFDPRVLLVIGLSALAAFLFLGSQALGLAVIWISIAIVLGLLIWGSYRLYRYLQARKAAKALEAGIDQQLTSTLQTPEQNKAEVDALRTQLLDAVKTIKTSKLGQTSGSAALYELPWYMIIGNPAAGKSTAVVKSGLTFPFANGSKNIIQGIGGTRNCDWYFTNEGILLDTAGRYSVYEEDRTEWLGFLGLLKKHRPKAPINGIMIAASLGELATGKPEQAIQLAKNLRQRVQELTENLEVFAPVYVVFTKADLISGFAEFFEDRDPAEREHVWGATLPYSKDKREDAVSQFDKHFAELQQGLREMSIARMSVHRGQALPPGVLTFPHEFAALKPALRSFIATLFEENPYQFQPVFRGFYFTSSVQEGTASSVASENIARQFALSSRSEYVTAKVVANNGFFLKDLFSKVIFADKGLVEQYASKRKLKLRAWSFAAGVAVLAATLGAWSWSYMGNRQLMAQVQADLTKAIKIQEERPDLAARLEALELLQDRIEMLQRYERDQPMGIGFGLYQGDKISAHLKNEYFNGVRQVMLEPVAQAIEAYLIEVNSDPSRLKPMTGRPESGASSAQTDTKERAGSGARYVDASVEDAADAYNALKTYLMLADRERLEGLHLADQITRFWRVWLDNNRGAMPREQMMRSAERIISFTTAQVHDPAFPMLENKLALVDQTRGSLREVVKGMRGIERVYADIKTRAATRFSPITVNSLLTEQDQKLAAGSYTVSGAFTHEAWTEYIEKAFKEAATNELQSADWVLKTASRDDLTLEGSPDQIRKTLTELYKTEYVREWQRFMQGIVINDFGSFSDAVDRMNRFGDTTHSPIKKLMTVLFDQTSWDNPSLLNQRLGTAQQGVLQWIKQSILRMSPGRVDVKVDVTAKDAGVIPMGPIGKEFASLSMIMMTRDSSEPQIQGYLKLLSKLRTKFNEIKNQGDPGPGARALMSATLAGNNSELSEALRYVDEQMLNGMTDTAKATIRPLLVRPLMQAMTVLTTPTEAELNRVWTAQVYEPFQKTLANKYPFDARSRIEASPQDIAKIFGPEGAISKFGVEAMGPMVIRRGDSVAPKTWGEIGLRLRPEFIDRFGIWVAALEGAAAASGGGASPGASPAAAPASDQAMFQILPQGSPGISEYTLTIDGQALKYRNTAPDWITMVWPNHSGVAGVRLSAVTNEGKSIEFLNEPGAFGFSRMIELAARKRIGEGHNELTWSKGNLKVSVQLKLIKSPGEAAPATATGSAAVMGSGAARFQGMALPVLVVGADTPATPAPPGAPAAPPPAAVPTPSRQGAQ
jgi:type VI secretion system protein ImpL